jgi:hypothetical protein
MRKLTAAIIVALLTTAGGADAAEIKALISTPVAAAMEELVPQFERASGHTLRITYGPSGGVAKRLTGGEAADLIILADTGLDDLTKHPLHLSTIRSADLRRQGAWTRLRWPWFVVRGSRFVVCGSRHSGQRAQNCAVVLFDYPEQH